MKKKNNGNRLQTVGLLFVESKKQTNLQRRVRLPHLPLPLPPPPTHIQQCIWHFRKHNDEIWIEQSGHLHALSRAPRNSFLRRFPRPSRSIHHVRWRIRDAWTTKPETHWPRGRRGIIRSRDWLGKEQLTPWYSSENSLISVFFLTFSSQGQFSLGGIIRLPLSDWYIIFQFKLFSFSETAWISPV